ncbi:MAG: membrane protein insertion efficiency factor YidD [Desulfobacterales bacterium]|nr:membrane protein insertion efficiency factor YidD [Desulfobacterales bacterium]
MYDILRKIAANCVIFVLRFYQAFIGPLLQANCRHFPSCSQYTIEAVEKYGVIRGTCLGLKRICRCHPWGTSGYDPVPDIIKGSPDR